MFSSCGHLPLTHIQIPNIMWLVMYPLFFIYIVYFVYLPAHPPDIPIIYQFQPCFLLKTISKLVPCSKRCWCSVWWLCPLTNTIIGDYHGPLGRIKTMQTPGYKLKNMFLYHVFGLSLQRPLCNYHL